MSAATFPIDARVLARLEILRGLERDGVPNEDNAVTEWLNRHWTDDLKTVGSRPAAGTIIRWRRRRNRTARRRATAAMPWNRWRAPTNDAAAHTADIH